MIPASARSVEVLIHVSTTGRVTLPAASRRRQMGIYYTPTSTADYMADWLLRGEADQVLEPSFGDGVFLAAVARVAQRRDLDAVRVRGVELDAGALGQTVSAGLVRRDDAILGDFLDVEPFPADCVIGNPPYVRIRHLQDARSRRRALEVATGLLPKGMDPSGSIWMPFVLHATQFLRIGGRMALVLPYDVTYVRYARPLWEFLGQRFSSLRVVRVYQRLFPDLLQDVVLLFADGHGGHTTSVEFETYSRVQDLLAGRPDTASAVSIAGIVQGDREFVAALLPADLQALLQDRLRELTQPAHGVVKFNIGYVTGDKRFFHPGPGTVRDYHLPASSLVSALTSSRALRGTGLYTSSVGAKESLFLPPAAQSRLGPGERRYIQAGEESGVDQRFKCRVRKPWYVVPGVKVPDLVLSVFSSVPLLMVNDAGTCASNSLLCGYTRGGADASGVAASWYTSLTLLECELRIHSLGGGVLIIIPGEADKVRLPSASGTAHLAEVDASLRTGDIAGAYAVGDRHVLRSEAGLSDAEIELLRDGVDRLRRWRERSPEAPW
jgi:adenine-specific DNA-methyltransferase